MRRKHTQRIKKFKSYCNEIINVESRGSGRIYDIPDITQNFILKLRTRRNSVDLFLKGLNYCIL